MVDYSKSIIYTIRSKDNLYVGSTVNFRSRKWDHKSAIYNKNSPKYNYKLYKIIRENDGLWDMHPYSKYPCNDIVEQGIEEERVRQLLKADLNSQSCGSGCSTDKERKKQYRDQNKDKHREYDKQYYEQNKDKITERINQYRDQNKDKINEQKKQFYKQNKDKIREKAQQKITCECGYVVSKAHLSRHRNSKKHINFMLET